MLRSSPSISKHLSRPPTRFWRFRRCSAGAVAVIFALSLPVALVCVGVGVDYLTFSHLRAKLQAAADGAATAGARELAIAGVKDSQIQSVIAAFVESGVEPRNGPHRFETTIDKKKFTVTVSIRQDWTPSFAKVIDSKITPVGATATAALVGTTNVCVLTLDPQSLMPLHLDLIARLQANGCAVYSNSKSLAGIEVDALASMTAALICSAGGVVGLLSHMRPAPTTDCPVLPDPIQKRSPPPVGGCVANNLAVKDEVRTLNPGTYCGGIAITGSSKVHFSPGTYVIKDGPFTIAGKSVVDANDVGFYLSGNAALIDFRGQTDISLSGAEDGLMAGLLFFEDRASKLGRLHKIRSTNAHRLTGTIYLPRGKLLVDPNALVASDSAYTAIVSYRLELTQGPTLVLNSDYGATSVPVPDGIRSTGQVVLTR
jgi:Flp pilus assembly protein TadG